MSDFPNIAAFMALPADSRADFAHELVRGDDAPSLARLLDAWPQWRETVGFGRTGGYSSRSESLLFASVPHFPLCAQLLTSLLDEKMARDTDPSGATPLMRAALNDNAAQVALLAGKIDIHARDRVGDTAVSLAAASRAPESLRVLLAAGADPRSECGFGRDPLMQAAIMNRPNNLRILLPLSDPTRRDRQGQTALAHAVWHGSTECALILIPVSDLSLLFRGPSGSVSLLSRALSLAEEAGSADPSLWAAVDALAVRARPPARRKAFARGGPERMPQCAAQTEAKALGDAVKSAGKRAGKKSGAAIASDESASTAPRAEHKKPRSL